MYSNKLIILRSPIVKFRFLNTLGIGVSLIEILSDLIRARITGEIVPIVVADHVLGEILTASIARHKLLSFVVH
tara:strand:- start:251 stop:472 length:222 start_codon:yes stop_codon:yes gene_type:complete